MTLYLRLYWEFFKTGLFAIGGGMATLPFLKDIGATTGWFSQTDLMNMLAVSESTPGPVGINMATYVGYTVGGVPGAIVATIGEVTPSIIVILIVAAMLAKFRDSQYVANAFYGLRPASTGLIGAACAGVMLQVIAGITSASQADSILMKFSWDGAISWRGIILALVLLVFTRWHEDDLIGRIAAREPITDINEVGQRPAGPSSWLRLNFEAVKQGPPTSADPRRQGEPLWPARHSSELLEQKRRLDPMLFETMYQGNPSSAEGVLYGDRFATYDKLPERTIKKGNYTDTADSGEDYLCSVCYETGTDDTIYITDVLYTPLGMEATEPLVAAMLQRNGTRTARIESNNGGRGFARAVAKLCPQTRIEWFHQYRNKEARVLSNATEVAARIRMPEDWHRRWSEFYGDVVSFRRLFRSNRRDDAPDVLTGIVETESAGPGKCIRAVGFSG